ncbi:MAG: mannose-1-phosphate guanylyltransferase [Candidatus Limnocylindrales bacterium]
MYAVILAGGGGTRLWPLSSPERPKPFLPLLGERTLLQRTVDRLEGLVQKDLIYVVTDQRYAGLVHEQVPRALVISEPMGLNTAPAIALATVAIDRPDDEVMLVLPADQTINNEPGFRGVLRAAEVELALGSGSSDPLVTLGIQITRPATEYGYLIPNAATKRVGNLTSYVLDAFQEKPSIDRAEELWRQGGDVAWNAGMFMWRRRAIRAALEQFAPDVIHRVSEGYGSDELEAAYAETRSISIDFAVMQDAAAAGWVVMGAMNVGWNDLGSWASLLSELEMPAVAATIDPTGDAFEANHDDLVVWRDGSGRLIATPGSDATMVATEGPVAVLRDALSLRSRIEPLLARCSTPEASQ